MSQPSPPIVLLGSACSCARRRWSAFLIYVVIRYTPIIGRIFEEKPLFLPLRARRRSGGEDVRFPTADGLELAGTYLQARTREPGGRAGLLPRIS